MLSGFCDALGSPLDVVKTGLSFDGKVVSQSTAVGTISYVSFAQGVSCCWDDYVIVAIVETPQIAERLLVLQIIFANNSPGKFGKFFQPFRPFFFLKNLSQFWPVVKYLKQPLPSISGTLSSCGSNSLRFPQHPFTSSFSTRSPLMTQLPRILVKILSNARQDGSMSQSAPE